MRSSMKSVRGGAMRALQAWALAAGLGAVGLVVFSAPPARADDPPACAGMRNDWVNDVRDQRRVSDLRAFRRRIVDRGLTQTCPELLRDVDRAIAQREGAAPPPPQATRPGPAPRPVQSSAGEDGAIGNARAANNCAGWRDFLSRFPNGRYRAEAERARDAVCPQAGGEPAAPPPLTTTPPARRALGAAMPPGMLDARTTPASTRAPIVVNPAGLPDFALFRECAICPEMVVIPAGSFVMGSPAAEVGRLEDEDTVAGPGGVQVPVTVRRFAIGRFEITWEEWAACTAAGYCTQPTSDEGWGQGRRPVTNINWEDAGAYATFLNGRTVGGYRRPSEAEWEYAARADTRTRFSWGDQDPVCATGNAANGANTEACFNRTLPVGSYRANPWGLFDVHGNIDEWVEDCDSTDSLANTPRDGAAALAVTCAKRVLRSGSWAFRPAWNRSALRDGFDPSGRRNWFGFRVARSL